MLMLINDQRSTLIQHSVFSRGIPSSFSMRYQKNSSQPKTRMEDDRLSTIYIILIRRT